jgi:cell division protein FtsN
LYLQLGAFSSRGNAERYRAELAAWGLAPLVVQAGSAAGRKAVLYHVRLDPLADVLTLDAAAEHMRALGIKGFRATVD